MSHYELEEEIPVIGGAGDSEMLAEDAVFFKGKKLEVFNGRRVTLANLMGMRCFRLTNDEREAISTGDTSTYAGFLLDIQLVLFVCSHSISVSLEAVRNPTKVIEKAILWAEKQNIQPGKDEFQEASEAFAKLMSPIFKNDAVQELAPEDSTGPKKKARQR